MKTIVKIDRNSIKRNPNAGQTQSHILGATRYYFDYGYISAFDFQKIKKFESERELIITTWGNRPGSKNMFCNGECIHEQVFDKLPKSQFLHIEIKKHIETFNHLPDVQWLYKFIPTKVKCENCKRSFFVTDIKVDWNDDGAWNICPHCNRAETFDFECEDIYVVVKEMGIYGI